MTLLSQVLACPATLPLALLAIAFACAVAFLAADSCRGKRKFRCSR